jgi:hypothetical protein
VGGASVGSQAPWDARPGSGPGRRSVGLLGLREDIFPETLWRIDWGHKTAAVLDALPKSMHPRAKKAIREITEVENKAKAERAIEEFAFEFAGSGPKPLRRSNGRTKSCSRSTSSRPSTGCICAPLDVCCQDHAHNSLM